MAHDPGPAPDGAVPGQNGPARGVTRRSFVQTIGISAAATSLGSAAADALARQRSQESGGPEGVTILGPDPVEVTLNINGKPMMATIEPATTLMEALRLHLNLTGCKDVCDRGACGACSVLVDGRLTAACMLLALDAVGSQVTTVEGLAKGDPPKLDPVQECFVRHDALQCGYCTPGLIMACRALLNENPKPTLEQIKHGLSGNICRCGTYTNIFNAALEASGQAPIMDQKGA